jgi:hypothetical protein
MIVDLAYPDSLSRNGGAYTILKKVQLDADTAPSYIEIAHGLKREPNWVRVTCLSRDVPDESPNFVDAKMCPAILDMAPGDDLQWNPGEETPTYPSGVIDLTESLYFGVYNADQTQTAEFLVEIGITHSTPK